jgi:hypothetical protein
MIFALKNTFSLKNPKVTKNLQIWLKKVSEYGHLCLTVNELISISTKKPMITQNSKFHHSIKFARDLCDYYIFN